MNLKRIKKLIITLFLAAIGGVFAYNGQAQRATSVAAPTSIPKTWVDEEVEAAVMPLADASASPRQITADYYYRIPVRPIYKSYPAYAPGKEPPGYQEWLKQQEPETQFDASQLKTKEDWIRAGEIVFKAPIFYNAIVHPEQLQDPEWYKQLGIPALKDGTFPFFRYVVREKGKVEIGSVSCAMCHTRLMPDGTLINGAQGNFPLELASVLSARPSFTAQRIQAFERSFFGAPWVTPDPQAGLDKITVDTFAAWHGAIPPGVMARQGSDPRYPPQVPDLIGVKDRKYLDHTGISIHRSIADMMRYAALNQGAGDLANYGGFVPLARDSKTLPDPATQGRYSDEQLYALALYIYSLEPPANPNKFDDLAARGQKVFAREGCARCHTPPLYTNNQLTPVDGFNVPEDHRSRFDIMSMSVGTDTRLALRTRRGTGYYKVPSLKGVWYRGPFEHNGSVATLEDWFDPRRVRDDYLPTGFRGAGVTTRAVKGHLFGLDLSPEDRRALIAFLKTL